MKPFVSPSVLCQCSLKIFSSPSMCMPTMLRAGTMTETKHFLFYLTELCLVKGAVKRKIDGRESPLQAVK